MSDEGASPRELILSASRRNNPSLLLSTLSSLPPSSTAPKSTTSATAIAQILNTATDGLGNYCLHIAAAYGNYDVLDAILDQEGVEVDPVEAREGDTPLHKSVRWVNGLSSGEGWEEGKGVVELLLDAGADPRIRNKAKLKPVELVDPRNTELRQTLQKAEFAFMAGDDVVDGDEDEGGPTGSASDSD